jgi:hypothetical protein
VPNKEKPATNLDTTIRRNGDCGYQIRQRLTRSAHAQFTGLEINVTGLAKE